MTEFLNTLSKIFSTFGASVFIPIILFIISRIAGVTRQKAFRSALLCAVGLTGFSLVINSFGNIIAPVVNDMVTNAGVDLPILDTGWQSVSVIAYSTTVGVVFIGIALVIQLVLFLVKWTDVFMASDLWNNYSFMVWGSLIFALTKSMALALICMILQLLYILLFSEVVAKRWSNYYQYPNCCMTAPHHLEAVPFAILMNWLLGKLGFNKIKVNSHDIQKKFGIFGEPMFIGLVVGFIIGIIGEFGRLNTLEGWGTVTGVAVATASVMAVFPKVGGIFASAFTSLTEAFRKKAEKSGEGREWYLSVNDAAGYGEPNTLTTGVLLMPIILAISFILPGNRMLPMADLVALPYMVEVFVAVSHGNVVKSMVMGTIWFSIGMVLCSILAPAFTEIAVAAGFELPSVAVYVMSFGIMAHPFMILLFYICLSKNPIYIGLAIAVYFVAYFLFKKNRQKIYTALENNEETVRGIA